MPCVRSLSCTLVVCQLKWWITSLWIFSTQIVWHRNCHWFCCCYFTRSAYLCYLTLKLHTSQVLLLWSLKLNTSPYLVVNSIGLNCVCIQPLSLLFYRATITSMWCIDNMVIVRNCLNGIMRYWKENPDIKFWGGFPLLHKFSYCYCNIADSLAFLSVTLYEHFSKFRKMTEFVLESETAGKIKTFLISLFTASVLLLQSVFCHGSLKNRHGKRKLLNVSHVFGTSLKLSFV